ncbi:F-box protein At4g35930-like [Dioscorea cayenensis subsp. rotundata]|uniref:F-box protein At4g35930-like n=1 Tax=Dioscorea cayennensis subsp. rotundata TaxID=55577 RepID=A0AB40CGH5_DIOCR|nr:F-box protein At4g35930-like [Dioscorea cayenensis subsp. rotundata]
MAFKQKKRVKRAKTKCMKLNCSKTPTKSSSYIDIDIGTTKDENIKINTPPSSPSKLNVFIPKTPDDFEPHSLSMLESLPLDILVKILCYLHHDELRAVFHVSRKIQRAVVLARQSYFNYTTPDRSRQEMLLTKTPLPNEHWPFLSKDEGGNEAKKIIPQTPKAPKPAPRNHKSNSMETKQVAAILFQEPSNPPNNAPQKKVPRLVCKPINSSRVLLYEDELCQAVAQNKLK